MTAELLRRAAAKMRENAQAATPGPWLADRVHSGDVLGVAVTAPSVSTADGSVLGVTDIVVPADGHHIASWHPTIAVAVADWLDGDAAFAEQAAKDFDMPEFLDAAAPLADKVARLYLGESA